MYFLRTLQDESNTPPYVGLFALLLGLPLLLWQAFPANQQTFNSASSFLVAHSLMEIFAVIVAALIFFIAYGTRNTLKAMRIITLGSAFLAAALFDAFHFLSYAGMPDLISSNNANKSILFWLAGRLSVGVGLLLYVWLADSRMSYERRARVILVGTLVFVAFVSYLIIAHPGVFPPLFIQGQGLTSTKIVAEWMVMGLYISTAMVLYWRRQRVVNCNVNSLMLALLLMAMGELFFTMYVQVTNTANMLGHIYKVIGYYCLYRGIFTETIHLPYQQMRKILSHDELTGLASRAEFNIQLRHAIDEAQAAQTACAVILMGLDNFKTVNATLGHEQGDLLLIAVAERIRRNLPESAVVARFSGDLFSILLKQTYVQDATRLGRELLHEMEQAFDTGKDKLDIGASMGIVVYPQDGDSASVLMRHADVSLHKAKSDGRNCLVVFSRELSEAINRRALIASRMKKALERGEFYLEYQPKVNLATGQICGWEALLRWQSAELGVVSPVEFIPVAEENGMILQIGDWVLSEACRQVSAWRALGLQMGSVAVNLSARQFRQKDLPEKIQAILQQAKIEAGDISLEITESAIMDNPASAAHMLEHLAKLGIFAAIDDFGTGHSSLSYLKTFPVRALKIDRSFIRDIPADENDLAIVHSILSLGKSLGISVVAEGVETEEQLAYLQLENCDEIQGYLYSRPLAADDCVSLVSAGIPEYSSSG